MQMGKVDKYVVKYDSNGDELMRSQSLEDNADEPFRRTTQYVYVAYDNVGNWLKRIESVNTNAIKYRSVTTREIKYH